MWVKSTRIAPISQLLETWRGLPNVSEPESVTTITVEPSPTILLAEDDPVTRMLMTRFLKKAGYEVDAVANGSEALDKMTKRYYPMLVTDWEMPEMDGVALCKAVRNCSSTAMCTRCCSPRAIPRSTSSRAWRRARMTIWSNPCMSRN